MSDFLNSKIARVLLEIVVVIGMFIVSDVCAAARPNILLILADDK